jgi:hypothetical protein
MLQLATLPQQQQQQQCQVRVHYNASKTGDGAFAARVQLASGGTPEVDAWVLAWSLPHGQRADGNGLTAIDAQGQAAAPPGERAGWAEGGA